MINVQYFFVPGVVQEPLSYKIVVKRGKKPKIVVKLYQEKDCKCLKTC